MTLAVLVTGLYHLLLLVLLVALAGFMAWIALRLFIAGTGSGRAKASSAELKILGTAIKVSSPWPGLFAFAFATLIALGVLSRATPTFRAQEAALSPGRLAKPCDVIRDAKVLSWSTAFDGASTNRSVQALMAFLTGLTGSRPDDALHWLQEPGLLQELGREQKTLIAARDAAFVAYARPLFGEIAVILWCDVENGERALRDLSFDERKTYEAIANLRRGP